MMSGLVTEVAMTFFFLLIILGATAARAPQGFAPIAIGLGVVGAGYVATQYVLSKINDARERMSSDRIAKEK